MSSGGMSSARCDSGVLRGAERVARLRIPRLQLRMQRALVQQADHEDDFARPRRIPVPGPVASAQGVSARNRKRPLRAS
jgi:hypothetical protein